MQHHYCNPQYLKVGIEGKEIVLPLVVNGSADIIYWKKNEDIVAEWSKGDSAFLKDSVKNELTSHTLIIRNLLQNDSGIYKAEAQVNSEIQYTHFCLKILDAPLSPPGLNCTINNGDIHINCAPAPAPATQGLPLFYFWEYNKTEQMNNEQFIVPFGKNTDLSENVTCTVIVANIKASNFITLRECVGENPYYQTRTGTRKHRNFLIIPIFITLGIIIMIVLRIKAFPKDIPEKEKEPLNEPRPVVENERQNNREDVLEGPGPSPEEGTLPVSGPKL
ncbi:uncharacterized protein LOC134400519 isoform X3 [Elgaria multicarinata webbii]|uniref:uncharacterized protein LOC134400519 isoform X3 n=1 Tax=Elgaria multicarinata webbii TaxID=159646 RepID=UPI002FCD2925